MFKRLSIQWCSKGILSKPVTNVCLLKRKKIGRQDTKKILLDNHVVSKLWSISNNYSSDSEGRKVTCTNWDLDLLAVFPFAASFTVKKITRKRILFLYDVCALKWSDASKYFSSANAEVNPTLIRTKIFKGSFTELYTLSLLRQLRPKTL